MKQLNQDEIMAVSGAKPISFFCSYALGQRDYDPLYAISIGTAFSILCLLPGLSSFTFYTVAQLGYESVIQSICGYYLATLIKDGPEKMKAVPFSPQV